MIALARQRVRGNVNCIVADVLTDPMPGDYDAIVSISALHHMPLHDALRGFATLLPGGVLAVVALPRTDSTHELPTEVVAAAATRVLGAAFATARAIGNGDWFAKDQTHAVMPVVLDPSLTTREVRDQAAVALPGVDVRRLIFWRYLLRWQKPGEFQYT